MQQAQLVIYKSSLYMSVASLTRAKLALHKHIIAHENPDDPRGENLSFSLWDEDPVFYQRPN